MMGFVGDEIAEQDQARAFPEALAPLQGVGEALCDALA